MNSLIAGNIGTGVEDDRRNRGVYATGGTIVNCTIAANTHSFNSSSGLELTGGTVTNTIIYSNTAAGAPRDYVGDLNAIWYSLAPELTSGAQGNLTGDPLFSDTDFRLDQASPCVNKGINQDWMALDLDGNRRVLGGTVDMGAYESEPPRGTLFLLR